jgi:hypothetical protein
MADPVDHLKIPLLYFLPFLYFTIFLLLKPSVLSWNRLNILYLKIVFKIVIRCIDVLFEKAVINRIYFFACRLDKEYALLVEKVFTNFMRLTPAVVYTIQKCRAKKSFF